MRVNVYNAKYQGTAVASFVNKAGSLDLRKYLVKGANRVTLTLLNNRFGSLAVALVCAAASFHLAARLHLLLARDVWNKLHVHASSEPGTWQLRCMSVDTVHMADALQC